MVSAKEKSLSLRNQCELMGLNRSSLYYKSVPISAEDQGMMNCMDEIFTMYPFYGSRRLRVSLQLEGFEIGRDHTRTLMRRLGLEAIYPKRNLSARNQAHKVYPYLLSGHTISAPGQVWSTDITYIR